MVGLAERVDPIECAHALEAQVRELRLIAAHKPRYNRRSKFPERPVWLKLTDEAVPAAVDRARPLRADGAPYLGPLRSQRQAEAVRDAIHDAVPLRQCTDRLSLRRVVRAACILAGIGRCWRAVRGRHQPAAVRRSSSHWSLRLVGRRPPARRAARTQAGDAVATPSATSRPASSATGSRRWCAPAPACSGCASLQAIDELVAARPDGAGGWELSVVRAGRSDRGRARARVAWRRGRSSTRCSRPPTSSIPTTRRWPRRPSASCAGSRSPAPGWCGRATPWVHAGLRRGRIARLSRRRRRSGRRRPVRRPPPVADGEPPRAAS